MNKGKCEQNISINVHNFFNFHECSQFVVCSANITHLHYIILQVKRKKRQNKYFFQQRSQIIEI